MLQKMVTCLFLSLGAYSCATNVTPSDSGPYAPARTGPKTGIVAYNPDGLDELVAMRRRNALKKIYEACGSNKYRITKETVADTKPETPESLATAGAGRLKYLHYECLN